MAHLAGLGVRRTKGTSGRGAITTATRATAIRARLKSAADTPAVVARPIQVTFTGVSHVASGQTTPAEIAALVVEHFGPEYVPASRPSN